jgi:hypothetical protein
MLGEVSGATLKRGVYFEIVVKIPSNPKITELESSCDAATHKEGTYTVKAGFNAGLDKG